MQIDDPWSNPTEGFEINEHASLVQSEVRDRLQAVMYASTPEGIPRHSPKAQQSLMQAVAARRYDGISFAAAALCTILAERPDLFLDSLDPAVKSSPLKIRALCQAASATSNVLLNEFGVDLRETGDSVSRAKVSYRQMADSLIALDLLIECCEFSDLVQTLLSAPRSYQGVQHRANWIARELDRLLAPHVDTKSLITKYQALVAFVQERNDRKGVGLIASDINDDVIFDFWVQHAHQQSLRVRLFRSAVDAWVDLYQSLISASHTESDTLPSGAFETLLDTHTLDRTDAMVLYWPSERIDRLVADPRPVDKVLLKSEALILGQALKCFPSRSQLWMTALRLLTLSKTQSTWIEAGRRQQAPISVDVETLLLETRGELQELITSLVDVEASIARLLLDLDSAHGLPACIEIGRQIAGAQDSPRSPAQVSNHAQQLTSTLDIDEMHRATLCHLIDVCLERGKKNRRGAFSQYNRLRDDCASSGSAEAVESILDDLQHLREETQRLTTYLEGSHTNIANRLATDYQIAYPIMAG